jgi:hypothetical protein
MSMRVIVALEEWRHAKRRVKEAVPGSHAWRLAHAEATRAQAVYYRVVHQVAYEMLAEEHDVTDLAVKPHSPDKH